MYCNDLGNIFIVLFPRLHAKSRSSENELAQPYPEVERFIHLRRRIREIRKHFDEMVEPQHPLKDYAAPSQEELHLSIAPPAIEARSFELKPALLQIVKQNQFTGNPTEDPNLHLSVFVQYTDTIKANGVEPEAIRPHQR